MADRSFCAARTEYRGLVSGVTYEQDSMRHKQNGRPMRKIRLCGYRDEPAHVYNLPPRSVITSLDNSGNVAVPDSGCFLSGDGGSGRR